MARTRLSRAERYDQLIEVSWALVRAEGADALTLGRLAERAGVAKPVVYSHFASRAVLLAALFQEFDDRQAAMLEEYLDNAEATLDGRAAAIANSYVGCTLAQGRELTGVLAALEGSPELEQVKRAADQAYSQRCREILAPFVQSSTGVSVPSITAIFGAAEALSRAAVTGDLSPDQATSQLAETIVAVAGRSGA
ncbi:MULTISPECIES: TetR/AcrR family transcriptional regulator [Nocardiaceae]|uniref:TetR/AcrR family transcriptional regulator n=1 Tax=Nocardiaceae TaxID=85025 RepID=UPI000522F127|nr:MULTISPECIES: TetR/AcrR family transcriptional regulator [Rhodococcus]OZD10125.1 TetR/AcrR family transcriptional regulator [Rhodococcus sp. 06-156-4C]OZD13934.1 TetR/AcrR family transcriptional regulator [Rhodococcus sp. 06-156-4a]OZD14714.1 TetR/AcrR family transcriptional regulator [Rhodococcus sp. 06-156-3C]OZD26944.1 TetR/AcrR family transcriptional regulator [Rhodococcus sp. 06-156-3b]OZD29795.1 TetR/AcrR family transcriptional regulator [Rhodococcus sp. 06-156-3]